MRLDPLAAGIRSEAWARVEVLRGRAHRGGRARGGSHHPDIREAAAPGAHDLVRARLQVRTRVLNDDLGGDFRRWYPAFMPASERQDVAA